MGFVEGDRTPCFILVHFGCRFVAELVYEKDVIRVHSWWQDANAENSAGCSREERLRTIFVSSDREILSLAGVRSIRNADADAETNHSPSPVTSSFTLFSCSWAEFADAKLQWLCHVPSPLEDRKLLGRERHICTATAKVAAIHC